MLLNAGKEIEFKGKNLQDLEIDQEEIEIEHQSQININEQTNGNTSKTLNVNKKDILLDKNMSDFSSESVFCRNETNTEVDTYFGKATCSFANQIDVKNDIEIQKSKRLRWSALEKKVVLNYFKTHIKRKAAPKKKECLELIAKYSNLFTENDWVRVKTFVYNSYQNL